MLYTIDENRIPSLLEANTNNLNEPTEYQKVLQKILTSRRKRFTTKEYEFLSNILLEGNDEKINLVIKKLADTNLFFNVPDLPNDPECAQSMKRMNSIKTRQKSVLQNDLWKAYENEKSTKERKTLRMMLISRRNKFITKEFEFLTDIVFEGNDEKLNMIKKKLADTDIFFDVPGVRESNKSLKWKKSIEARRNSSLWNNLWMAYEDGVKRTPQKAIRRRQMKSNTKISATA